MHKTILLALIASLGGCALFGNLGGDSLEADHTITPEQEAKLRELGGEQLVADAHYANDLPETHSDEDGNYQVRMCFTHYLLARKADRSSKDNFRSCALMCEAADKRTDRHAEFTARYIETCRGEESKYMGAEHLARARKQLEAFEQAEGHVNQYYRAAEVRGALHQAEEALGADNGDLVTVRGEFDALYETRREALERVHAFFVRDDVKQIKTRISDLSAEVNALEVDAQYSEHAQVLLTQRKRDLSEAENTFSEMMREAKL